mmetsp:Transcript_21950/g.47762  ORF Transcript_21950/g.47762 Transcript_21950/m.47762 type:complete len:84 (-) Transcript_21950:1361-1612(-)
MACANACIVVWFYNRGYCYGTCVRPSHFKAAQVPTSSTTTWAITSTPMGFEIKSVFEFEMAAINDTEFESQKYESFQFSLQLQ